MDVWYGGGPWWLPVGGIQPGPMGAGRVEGGPGPAAAPWTLYSGGEGMADMADP